MLANKNDLPGSLPVDDMISRMRLSEIQGRAVSVSFFDLHRKLTPKCYSTSNKTRHNLDIVLAWLTQRAQ